MKLADIKKIDRSKLPNEDFKSLYDDISRDTDGFNPDFIELYDEVIKKFLTTVNKLVPEAITETVKKVRQPRKKVEKPIDFEDDDVVETVMEDYNLTKDKAVKLIALRKEAYELKKENLEKLLDRLDKSEFYQGKNSKAPIDKGRTRDLGKDSKQGSITLAEERKMTRTPFKRISKEGRKNQYGTTEGGNVYYEYRMNRRDVDKKIKLEKGGGVGIPNSDKMFHLPYEIAVYVPSTKDVDKNITATELRARVKEVEKYLAETFGGFTSAEKVGGYLSSKSSVVTEKVIPVTAFSTMQSFKDNKAKLVNKMSVWAKKWGQEAIGFEFEGDLYYVPQKFKTGGKLTATYIPKRDIKNLTTVWGNNIKGKDLIDGAYTLRTDIKRQPKMVRSMFEEEEFSEFKTGGKTKPKDPVIVRGYADDEPYEFGTGGLISEMKKIDRSKLPSQDFKNLYDELKRQTDSFDPEYSDFFAPEMTEFLRALGSKLPVTFGSSVKVSRKDFLLTQTELPIPIYTYLPNIRYELNKEYKENLKKLSNEEFIEYLNTAQRLKVDGHSTKFYHVGWNDNGRGYAVNLQNAFRCKKYLEKLGYKVAIGQNNFRFDPEQPVQEQQDFYDVYTDTILPKSTYQDLVLAGIMNANSY